MKRQIYLNRERIIHDNEEKSASWSSVSEHISRLTIGFGRCNYFYNYIIIKTFTFLSSPICFTW